MNAIRRDEDFDTMHSCYVDQWGCKKVITKEDRKLAYLKKTVKKIYSVLKNLSKKLRNNILKLSIIYQMISSLLQLKN